MQMIEITNINLKVIELLNYNFIVTIYNDINQAIFQAKYIVDLK